MKVEIIPATVAHAEAIAQNLREADRQEIAASSRFSPRLAIRLSVLSATRAWAGFADEQLVCLFGVSPVSLIEGRGAPWMIGTPLVERYATAFLRRNKRFLPEMQERFTVLENYVDERNALAIRWLQWLGFQMDEPLPHGPHGLPFRRFELRR
jgi:hypothetical protein